MTDFSARQIGDFLPIIDRISKDWMLITASDGERVNSMTASWGCIGELWHRPVAICFIRPQRYTFDLTEHSEKLSLSFFDREYHGALSYMGSHSGRDGDKYAATGLHVTRTEDGTPFPVEARDVLICRKLYADWLKEDGFIDPALLGDNYPGKDFHRVLVSEITQVLTRGN